ncbi:MAG: FdhF/YdeP family oxidoreductase [Thermoanaerobaculia bacterium]
MATHRVTKGWKQRVAGAIPFGAGQVKPHHFANMAQIAWKNRDNLGYAYQVLSQGVCDGCALGVAGFHDWTIEGVHLCMTRLNLLRLNTMPAMDEARLTDVASLRRLTNRELRELGRLPYPMLRSRGAAGFTRLTWDDALTKIASSIRETTPERLAFFVTSRGVTNEVYYMAQKVARFLGTNSVDNAARLCHSPSTAAMKTAIGVGASTCSYVDWIGTDLIVFFGSNPANDQPVVTKYLEAAKKAGTKIAVVNPYQEPGMTRYWVPSSAESALFGTDMMDYWFPVSQGGDIAFLSGVLKVLLSQGWIDSPFVSEHTDGLEALKARVAELDWAVLEADSGLTREGMQEFAELIHASRNAVLVWSMGITQHAFGADAVSMILNLGLSQGYVGRDKAGLVPIRGHSSVQGGAEMGAYSTAFPGGKPINRETAAELSAHYGFEVPSGRGLQATEMVEAAFRKELDVLYCVGGNFLQNLPDPRHVATALSRVPLRVHQDILVNDQMLVDGEGDVILLPAKTRYEQDDGGVETSTERRVMFSPEIPRQVGEARAEWRILRDLAAAVRPESAGLLGCETGWAIREEIARVIPFYAGIETLKETGDAFQYGGRHLCIDGDFPTPDRKAHFAVVALPSLRREPGVFEVTTRRGKQFNSLIYAERDPLNGAPRDAVLINRAEAESLGLKKGDPVVLVNACGRFAGSAFPAPIAPGNLQVHYPEGNILIPGGVVDAGGGVPAYSARVRIEERHGTSDPSSAS